MMQALTRLTLDHPDYYYDRKTNRYKYKDTNRFAPKQAILALTEKYRDRSQADLIKLAHQYHSGQLSLEQFQRLAASNIKQIHLAEAILGAGGVEVMTPARFLIVARQLNLYFNYGINNDPEYFPEPETFKPERFLNKEGVYCKDEHLVFFGVGKR
ncbi:MAG: cytochrome P450, partial [Symploca sp. SIO1A3]|nr:cytochrome P450 [Symploca sp. SIO1A3]